MEDSTDMVFFFNVWNYSTSPLFVPPSGPDSTAGILKFE